MNKLRLLVINIDKLDIVSLGEISKNIAECYNQLDSNLFEVEHFLLKDLSKEAPTLENFSTIYNKLATNPPDFIIFAHSYAIRTHFFKVVIHLLNKNVTTLIFHIYGDFIRQSFRLFEVERKLKGFKICFISPSANYSKVIAPFFFKKQKIHIIPFPVSAHFNFNEDFRLKIREMHNFKSDEFIFIYTGRISKQKNVLKLWDVIQKLNIDSPAKLLIVGNYVDYENPTIGLNLKHGEMFNLFHTTYQSNANVIHLSGVSNEDLVQYYSAADIFISASLFHDEDFGLSPVEAASSGLQLILSSWGGFTDIIDNLSPFTKPLPVAFEESSKSFKVNIPNFTIKKLSNKERYRLSHLSQKIYSIKSCSIKMQEILQSKIGTFEGLNSDNDIFNRAIENKVSVNRYLNLFEKLWKN